MSLPLHSYRYSLAHRDLLEALAAEPNLLVIQDLDGVCMGLVRDPRLRCLAPGYIRACKQLAGRFYVLTNGEHVGSRGVNTLVDRAFEARPAGWAQQQGMYLPGLAAGGVQFQDCFGRLSYPGVSERELAFLETATATMAGYLRNLLSNPPYALPDTEIAKLLDIVVLDNAMSPTVNIGSLFECFRTRPSLYRSIQAAVARLMDQLLEEARWEGLEDAFFVHLAPNLGAPDGIEILKSAGETDMGTTDFQLMLRGAVKEVGVLVLLNDYYFLKTGSYPLGADFNAREAPREREQLLALAERNFDPRGMPRIVAVGDTVTSSPSKVPRGGTVCCRGGSDRGFLTLVQELGLRFGTDNAVIFVDSSSGELNRPGVDPRPAETDEQVPLASLRGITDGDDPLALNFVFPEGHRQYTAFFTSLARCWSERTGR